MKKIASFKLLGLILGLILVWLVHNIYCQSGLIIIENYGLSLSINIFNIVFLNIVFVLILGWVYLTNSFKSLGLILIGGMVNLIDRLYFGYVRDYWNLGGGVVNNLNDWIIGIGVLLFLIELLWKKSK
ncbi:MAG: signal peptidase II [Candidatus Shapirobacteria bacterium]